VYRTVIPEWSNLMLPQFGPGLRFEPDLLTEVRSQVREMRGTGPMVRCIVQGVGSFCDPGPFRLVRTLLNLKVTFVGFKARNGKVQDRNTVNSKNKKVEWENIL
jgi:hypothetical protein